MKFQSRGEYVGNSAGKTCSRHCHIEWIRNNPERKRKIGDAFRGERHPNWQGGKSLLNNVSRRGVGWQVQRTRALKRDGFKCVDCGMTNDESRAKFDRGLDVDHIVPFHNFRSVRAANALSNLASRCASCHRIAEAKRSMVQMVLPIQDSVKRMHKGYRRGETHPRAKRSAEDVREIRRLVAGGLSQSEVGRLYGVDQSYISAIVRRLIWRSVA